MACVRLSILLAGCAIVAAASEPGRDSAELTFRRWFAFLAESRFYARKPLAEVSDGPGLVRWAWQNTIVPHDARWRRKVELPVFPAMHAVEPARGNARSGVVPPRRLVSLDIADVQPGDLLVYRPAGASEQVMVYVGKSQIVPSRDTWVVYLDGPSEGRFAQRVHRLKLESLLADPNPAWQPVAENSAFAGIFRLEIPGASGE